jgi:hypothetical protein
MCKLETMPQVKWRKKHPPKYICFDLCFLVSDVYLVSLNGLLALGVNSLLSNMCFSLAFPYICWKVAFSSVMFEWRMKDTRKLVSKF